MRKGKKAKTILKWISWGFFIAFSALIILEAAMPADQSSAQSGFLASLVASFLDLFPNVSKETYEGMEGFLRKAIGPFGLFMINGSWGILAFLLTFDGKEQRDFQALLCSGAIGLVLALGSEAIQLIPALNRSGEFLDALIDISGYLLGLLICFFIFHLAIKEKSEAKQ